MYFATVSNWQIRQTLEKDDDRNRFWILNNGIVCLCTNFEPVGEKRIDFTNFTIVNGAQTINTIAKFLEDNPAIQEPVWVFGKIIRVSEDNIEYAIELTKTSNTQTPTNSRDLRAVDVLHKRIKLWFDKYFGLNYIFKRGERVTRAVSMKELAQSYIAYWEEDPHISFGRPGKIFADSDYYDLVFPGNDIDELFRVGSEDKIKDFISIRLLPFNILIKIKENLEEITRGHTDKKWKSLSYHILWIYLILFDKENLININILLNKYEEIIMTTIGNIFDSLIDFCLTIKIEVPRDFKTNKLAKEIKERYFIDTRAIRKARAEIMALVNP